VGFFLRSEAFLPAVSADHGSTKLSRGSHTLLSLGFSPEQAKRLGQQLSDIGALVYVPCAEGKKAARIIDLLRRTGAREAASLGTVKAPAVVA
jgi:hypothetical protein